MLAEATSRLAVRAVAWTVLGLALSGCSQFRPFGKDRSSDNNNANANNGGGVAPPRFPTGGVANQGPGNNFAPTAAVTNPANQGAILAGRVIDNYSRPPANTSIRWVSLDDKRETENDVSVTPEGYFTIQGLKPNGQYKLIARGKQGERLVAGVSYTTAPNIRVLIQVKEDLANGSTPPVPGPAGTALQDNPKAAKLHQSAGNEPDLPVAINIRQPGAADHPPSQNWTAAPGVAESKGWLPPTLEIKGGRATLPPLQIGGPPNPAPPAPAAVPPSSPALADALTRARIPSCVRIGDQIVNFALNDANGQPWEFRYKKSKLVLVDFWRTDCVPCLQSLPHLRELQSKYGSYGLEVIGVANETDGTPQEQAYRVMNVCKRYGVNYRQLLSVGRDCPVRNQFKINFVPTLFLLDEQGFIVWQTDHTASPAEQRADLERHLQRRLTTRAF